MRVGLLRGLFIGAVASLVAAITAAIGSLLMPIGPLRALEPHRGIDVDVTVVGCSMIAIVVLVALQSAIAAGRTPRHRAATPVRWAERVTGSTSSPAIAAGMRFIFDRGTGDAAVPVRSTTFGVGLAVVALVATLVFLSGLEHFTSTPRLYGWIWSYQVEYAGPQTAASLDAVSAHLARDPHVRAAAPGAYAQLGIEGRTVAAIAVETGLGVPVVQMVSGHAPHDGDEIAVGAETLRSLHHDVGDALAVSIGGVTRRFRIVGQGVFPRFAPYPASVPTGLGEGAAMTLAGLRRFGDLDAAATSPVAGPPFVLLDTGPGTTPATVEHLAFPHDPSQGLVLGAQRPNYVVSYQHLERTPLALAALLILLALASTLHLLVSVVRRRRHDLGTLRALGFTTRQVRGALLVQSTTLIGLALLVAIPVGIFAGRLLWSLTAHWLGIAVYNVVPVTTIVAVAAIALLVANAAALVPAAAAVRVSAAESLRRE
jgi:ABC-type lipoprotein release transport system permease subunit